MKFADEIDLATFLNACISPLHSSVTGKIQNSEFIIFGRYILSE